MNKDANEHAPPEILETRVKFLYNGVYYSRVRITDVWWLNGSNSPIYKREGERWFGINRYTTGQRVQDTYPETSVPNIEIEYQRALLNSEREPDYSHLVTGSDLGLV